MALARGAAARSPSSPSHAPTARFPRSARCIRRPSGSNARSAISSASMPRGPAGYAALARSRPLGRDAAARDARADAGAARAVCVPAGRRREPAPDPGRSGACRHHRARAFPLHRQRRDRRAAGAAPRLRAQGHRRPDGGRDARRRPRKLAGRTSGDSTVAYALAFARAVEAALGRRGAAARASAARADGGAGAPRQPFRRYRRDLQRRLVLAHARALRHSARARAARGAMPASATG